MVLSTRASHKRMNPLTQISKPDLILLLLNTIFRQENIYAVILIFCFSSTLEMLRDPLWIILGNEEKLNPDPYQAPILNCKYLIIVFHILYTTHLSSSCMYCRKFCNLNF